MSPSFRLFAFVSASRLPKSMARVWHCLATFATEEIFAPEVDGEVLVESLSTYSESSRTISVTTAISS